jgi:hypothetical protein
MSYEAHWEGKKTELHAETNPDLFLVKPSADAAAASLSHDWFFYRT